MAAATEYPIAAHATSDEQPTSMVYSQTSPTGASPPANAFAAGADSEGLSAPEPVGVTTGPGGSGLPTAPAIVPVTSAAGASAPSPTYTANSSEAVPKEVQDVLSSEIGIVTMLNRLKQSISTAKEFGNFLKKRAQLEEDYAAGMRKLARSGSDSMGRSDHHQGTFGHAIGEMMDIHARMADNGYQFSMSLHQMHEDLVELAAIAEKNRKGWKQTGLAAEQKVADLESATRKSKAKYDALAEEYDRVRTGDVGGRRGGFGFKGPKSAAQHEEDLLRKLQGSDEDYHARVDTLSRERADLLATGRPEAVKALKDLVRECDGGMVLQVQKYASFSEKLLLSNGLSVSPMKSAQKPDARSLREVVTSIDSERDLNQYIGNFHSKVPPKLGDPKYERHPVLGNVYGQQSSAQGSVPRTHTTSQSVSQPDTSSTRPVYPDSLGSAAGAAAATAAATSAMYGSVGQQSRTGPSPGSSHERSYSYSSAYGGGQNARSSSGAVPQLQTQQHSTPLRNSLGGAVASSPVTATPDGGAAGAGGYTGGPNSNSNNGQQPRFYANPASSTGAPAGASPYSNTAPAQQGAPQLGALPFQGGNSNNNGLPSSATSSSLTTSVLQTQPPYPAQQQQLHQAQPPPAQSNPLMQHPPVAGAAAVAGSPVTNLGRQVFGVSLDVLYDRDSLAVPMVVYQCIQAVDLFGLNVEGIYRLSGSLQSVNKLKAMFDTDSSSPNLDFRNPENFFHDVNSVAGLLKQFFRDLPDPLLTRENYDRFIEAAKHDDDTVRRDSLHAVINDLPDPNYATLRALILHLNRVVENEPVTRMTAQNLAIVFGPTLLGAGTGDPEKGRWHVRVIDTILQNTYQIFDED